MRLADLRDSGGKMNAYKRPQAAPGEVQTGKRSLCFGLALAAMLIANLYAAPLWLPCYESLLNAADRRTVWTVERALRVLCR